MLCASAKRKSDEMLARELLLKKECEAHTRDAQKMLSAENERTKAALQKVAELEGGGGAPAPDSKEKEELLQLQALLHDMRAEAESIQLQLKVQAPKGKALGEGDEQ